ncbi:hypothetical protein Trydic_g11441 [Trypoxylus dichotomus]
MHRQILFFNQQHGTVYARNSKKAEEKIGKVERDHRLAIVMVWWRVVYDGVTQLHSCKHGDVQRTTKLIFWKRLALGKSRSQSVGRPSVEYFRWEALLQTSPEYRATKRRFGKDSSLEVVRGATDEWLHRSKQCVKAKWCQRAVVGVCLEVAGIDLLSWAEATTQKIGCLFWYGTGVKRKRSRTARRYKDDEETTVRTTVFSYIPDSRSCSGPEHITCPGVLFCRLNPTT